MIYLNLNHKLRIYIIIKLLRERERVGYEDRHMHACIHRFNKFARYINAIKTYSDGI
jgi:hypothetical protein